MRRKLTAFLLCVLASRMAWACQAMDEVWFPKGVIKWGASQTTADILDGIHDTMAYYESRTPLQLTEIQNIHQGGMSSSDQLGALEVRYSEGIFNFGYGGETEGYRNPNEGKKIIRISFENVKTRSGARSTLAHEMGHALGFTHEFQRIDRSDNGVSVDFDLGRDPFNGGRPNKKDVRLLSPYDLTSKWATGYPGAKPPHNGPPGPDLLSKHDINCVYRVYGRALGEMSAGVMYGEAAAAGDFDGDGFEDIAIAAQYAEPGSNDGAIYFYKGVAQDNSELGAGRTYVAWFRETIAFERGQKHQIVLTTGDTHTMTDPSTPASSNDGIRELIVGLPGAARVEIWVINAAKRFTDGFGTMGGHGVAKKIVIHAADVGITFGASSSEFGASLAAGRFFNRSGDEIAIGAPGAIVATAVGTTTPAAKVMGSGAAVYLLPDNRPERAIKITSTSDDPSDQFGAALAVMTEFDHGHDTLVVGAPGTDTTSGRVSVYKRAYYDDSGQAIAPALIDAFSGSTTGGEFGRSLLAFTTREKDTTTHWIAIGAPTATVNGIESGTVDLLSFAYSGDRHLEKRLAPSSPAEGMHFGQSLAVQQGSCTDALCPREQIRIAIGAPQSVVSSKKAGAVHLWKVWSGGKATSAMEEIWGGANDDSRYGQDVVSLRRKADNGGFLVTGKKTTVVTMTAATQTGVAHVRLNKNSAPLRWLGWTKMLTPGTAGDTPPK
ncbi:MAG TPA: hypothetical protein VKB93_00090 [Thermoanaerobaculia bacterium]|nr:hypothetical protein [Thermoanaerobaculia bacterium]